MLKDKKSRAGRENLPSSAAECIHSQAAAIEP